MTDLSKIAENVICGRIDKNAAYPPAKKGEDGVKELVAQAISEGIKPQDILNNGLIAGMEVIGARFKANEVYVPEVLIAARAMKAGMELIKPLLSAGGIEPIGKFVIGTIKGDLHDIGKNLVAMMAEGAGLHVVDLGVDVSAEKFADNVKGDPKAVIGMSALLTTTMANMKTAIESIRQSGLKNPIIIGGAPVTQGYADEIGADGYAPDAATAVDVIKQLINS